MADQLALQVNERLKDVVVLVDEPMEGWRRCEIHIYAPRQCETCIFAPRQYDPGLIDFVSNSIENMIKEKGVINASKVRCEYKDETFRFSMRMCMTPNSN